MSSREPIAIVGSGCRFPGNVTSPSALWDLLRHPKDVLTSIPEDRFCASGFYHTSGQYHGHTNVKHSYLLDGGSKGTYRQFDAPFFGMSPAEADVTDPQLRLLLEVVFEALESSGETMDGLRGSNTAVYTGLMCADYERIMTRDEESLGTYHATGTSRALLSNRISYTFDWRGPSLTIDTACSSSLYAVHYAVQQLRSGGSRVAIAAGANLLLDPNYYIAESKLQMLSPDGQSRMWDASANGYGRGEGVAAVVMKTLSAAEADGDYIECIIRETAIGQDGRTKGITMFQGVTADICCRPSAEAQASLIRDCYSRAGLDLRTSAGRPQYFEAHGTGTPAGDPIEAQAITESIFGDSCPNGDQLLFVGSIKTVIGHTEGTAGLAGLLKTSLALQNSTIPQNMLFQRLNPRIEPFYTNVRVPTAALSWPAVVAGQPRRASVNSFGFGGANAHIILESYGSPAQMPNDRQVTLQSNQVPAFYPFIFSASSEFSLRGILRTFSLFLRADGRDLVMRDLSYTLSSRRSRLPLIAAFSAASSNDLATKIEEALDREELDYHDQRGSLKLSPFEAPTPRLLAVFTGQGAQWPRMGAELIIRSDSARNTLKKLEGCLAELPESDRPSWSLTEELLRHASSSGLHSAILSQPLCTAVQILLVDALQAAKLEFDAVVGHSSGEIAAAYAAGVITAEVAICIAYYRGLYSQLAHGQDEQKGAMLAVGTSLDDIESLLKEPEFQGRACVAAINSAASITVSGDVETIQHMAVIFKDEKKFARRLKVDRAYHSHHMVPCSADYIRALQGLNIQPKASSRSTWFSSVCLDGEISREALEAIYWDRNMVRPVRFMPAIQRACEVKGLFDFVVEIGPHPALKGPTLQTLDDMLDHCPSYIGLLQRDKDALETITHSVATISGCLGQAALDLQGYHQWIYGRCSPALVKDLPTYCWSHDKEYWHESRFARAIRKRATVHELLGHLTPDSSKHDMRWRHLLRPKEIPWMTGHRLQGQIVLPAAAYIVSAFEASLTLLEQTPACTLEVYDFEIGHALTFEEDSSVEIIFSLSNVIRDDMYITASFGYDASLTKDSEALSRVASGRIRIELGTPSLDALPARNLRPRNLFSIDENEFYSSLEQLEYQYSDSFRALCGLRRKLGVVTGNIANIKDSGLLVHPALLDVAFQSVFLAASTPGDGQLWSLHVPIRVRRVTINPLLFSAESGKGSFLSFDTTQPNIPSFSGDIDVFSPSSNHAMMQVEGLECVPFTPATCNDDRALFVTTVWKPAFPDAGLVTQGYSGARGHAERDTACHLERIACFYLRLLDKTVPQNHPSRSRGPYEALLRFSHNLRELTAEERISFDSDWEDDSINTACRSSQAISEIVDARLLRMLGQKLAGIVMGTEPLPAKDVATANNLLQKFFCEGVGMHHSTSAVRQVVDQIVHQNPRIQCLEIGAGTGAATTAILSGSGQPFTSYTFTDVDTTFFPSAQAEHGKQASNMIFETKRLDINQAPSQQGFQRQAYDLVVAHLVFETTTSIERALQNTRDLLKPGGYLIIAVFQGVVPARIAAILSAFPEWRGAMEDRHNLPSEEACLELSRWHSLLRQNGFSGCDSVTADHDNLVSPFTIIVSQAVDEKISFLRAPLSFGPQQHGLDFLIQDLVLIGGRLLNTSKLVAELETLLQPFCSLVKACRRLEDLSDHHISRTTTVLSLVDLDCPIFKEMDEPTWETVKAVFHEANTVFWITQGRKSANPHANMTIGLLRSGLHEIPGLTVQFLDVEDTDTQSIRAIAEAVLRLHAVKAWDAQVHGSASMATLDRELVIKKGGCVFVPRLMLNQDMNDRYNSHVRQIDSVASLATDVVRLVSDSSGCYLRKEHLDSPQFGSASAAPTFHTSYSLLAPIRFAYQAQLYVSLGKTSESSVQSLAISTEQASVIHPELVVPPDFDIPRGSEALLLHLVGLHQAAGEILEGLKAGDCVLLHEPQWGIDEVLKQRAHQRGVRLTIVTSGAKHHEGWLNIHPLVPDRSLLRLRLQSICVFVSLAEQGTHNSLGSRIVRQLLTFCKLENTETLFGGSPRASTGAYANRVHSLLREAIIEAGKDLQVHLQGKAPSIQAIGISSGISNCKPLHTPMTIVDWTLADAVLTRTQPVDSDLKFSVSKTYWLAGLTGSLGISLCQWMIERGARYLVLSSRSPKIDGLWVEEMRELGIVIKILSCDLASDRDVKALHRQISLTLPPIGGVANGAMILRDSHLSSMSFATLQQVLRPKVEGSINLDHLFQENTLDFFIFFSSISSIIGVPGQSAYNAANMFMASLAEQRRQRGLAASVINIGAIVGTGYISENNFNTSVMREHMAISLTSEYDFHQTFAEAVQSSRAGSSLCTEITAGLGQVKQDEVNQPKWASNPLMSHLILNPESGQRDVVGSKSNTDLKARLRAAHSVEQARAIVRDALLEKLSTLFHLPNFANGEENRKKRLDELGIDSLIAVEIRGWLMRNLQLNYPVLKILSGISIGELVEAATGGLDSNMLPNVQPTPTSAVPAIGSHATDEGLTTPAQSSAEVVQSESDTGSSYTPDTLFEASSVTEERSSSTWSDASTSTMTIDLSITQRMFWFVLTMLEDKKCLNHTISFRLRGSIRLADFRVAVRSLAYQHEPLRTRFVISEGTVAQSIMDTSMLELDHRWITSEDQVLSTERETQEHAYDIEKGETCKIVLLSMSAVEHFLILGGTTLSTDGLCSQILLQDLLLHYEHTPITQPTPQYREFFQDQKLALGAGKFQEDIDYWKAVYPDFPPPTPILRVSSVCSRPTLATFKEVRVGRKVKIQTKRQISEVCRLCRVTPFHFYLACFRVLLLRYAETEDVAIGIGDANRINDRWMRSVGVFINMLPIRFHSSHTDQFKDLLQRTRDKVYAGLGHSRVPFQALLEELEPPRSASCTPIFQCFVDYRMGQRESDSWGDCNLELRSFQGAKTGYDLNLDIIDDPAGECRLLLNVRSDLYTESGAELLIASYEKLIIAFAADPGITLMQPTLYPQREILRALEFSQGPLRVSKWPETVIHRIDQIATERPHEIAIQNNNGDSMSYLELMHLSYSVAASLSKASVTTGAIVAVLQEPTAYWVASLLGILRLGAIYTPLDLSAPWSRLEAIVEDCRPSIFLVDHSTIDHMHNFGSSTLAVINVSDISPRCPASTVTATAAENAMILYTSGSTGVPKGIVLNHEGIRNQLEAYHETYGLGFETVLQQSAFSFDHSYAQVFAALCHGGTIHLLPRHLRGDAQAVAEVIAKNQISHTIATPTEYFSWLKYGESAILRESSWRVAHCAGEPISQSLLAQFQDLRKPDLRLFNAYGPTEISVNATCMELSYNLLLLDDQHPNEIAAGSVLPNYSVYVVDEQLVPVPPGVQGEIYIGGAGLAAGYINNSVLTASKFVPDIFADDYYNLKGWMRMHRSGDLGRWTEDGNLLVEGRITGDTQVKIRGIRVDLQEVEQAILKAACGLVSEAVVTLRRLSSSSDRSLIAHVVLERFDEEQDSRPLLQTLSASLPLPQYMRPVAVFLAHTLPRTSSGKLDRKAVSELHLASTVALSSQKICQHDDLTQIEARLRDLWVEVIQPQIHPHLIMLESDFFDVGGTSLSLLTLQASIGQDFDTRLGVVQLLGASTLREMAGVVEQGQSASGAVVDWQKETRLSHHVLQNVKDTEDVPEEANVVVLTGATGHLGRAILDALIADPKVETVFCIAVRGLKSRESRMDLPKTRWYEGDLRLPRLGLSEADAGTIFSAATRIIHNGAQVSHMRYYHSLRLSNLQSTKELVCMCKNRRIPLHYVSTANIGVYLAAHAASNGMDEASLDFTEVSLAAFPPPIDGFGGYPASKWASEVFLEKLNEQTPGGWPIFVHRPSLISRTRNGDRNANLKSINPGLDIIHNIRYYAARLRTVPVAPNSLRGFIDTVTLADVVSGIIASLSQSKPLDRGVQFRHYAGEERLSIQCIKEWVGADESNAGDLQELPLREWARKAGEAGMDLTLVTMLESVSGTRELYFPKVAKSTFR